MGKYLELRPTRKQNGEFNSGAVYRKTVEPLDHRGRKIIVGLEPGDVISFREERTRRTYTIDIRWAMIQAIKKAAEQQQREKNKKKGKFAKTRRRSRRRL